MDKVTVDEYVHTRTVEYGSHNPDGVLAKALKTTIEV